MDHGLYHGFDHGLGRDSPLRCQPPRAGQHIALLTSLFEFALEHLKQG